MHRLPGAIPRIAAAQWEMARNAAHWEHLFRAMDIVRGIEREIGIVDLSPYPIDDPAPPRSIHPRPEHPSACQQTSWMTTHRFGNGGHHEEYNLSPHRLAPLHAHDSPPQAGFKPERGRPRGHRLYFRAAADDDSHIYSDDDFGLAEYYWSFGDGATATGRLARHSYAANGGYPVTLTVVDASGQRSMRTRYARMYVYEAP